AGRTVVDPRELPKSHPRGEYASPVQRGWDSMSLAEKIELLRGLSARLKRDERIVDWAASLAHVALDTFTLTSGGGRLEQTFSYVFPSLRATANQGTETQTRTFGRDAFCLQGGLEALDRVGFLGPP